MLIKIQVTNPGEPAEKREVSDTVFDIVNHHLYYIKQHEESIKSNKISIWPRNPATVYIYKGNEIILSNKYLLFTFVQPCS